MIKAPSPTRHLPSSWMGPSIAVALVLGFCLLLLRRDPQFFWNDDSQTCFLPAFRDMARAWGEGEPPLLSPSSWYGGALAGEFRFGAFSVFIQAVVVLMWKLDFSLPATAALFSMIHLGILAAGAFCLARQRCVAAELATMVAVVASLNGWIVSWAASTWIASLTSFAWVPWAWWALERALDGGRGARRFLPAGFFIYLVCAAGNPFSLMMTGIITLFLMARASSERLPIQALWPLVAAWAWGLALAAPALLMLVEHLQSGLRSGAMGSFEMAWLVPVPALLGLVAPYYSTEWLGFLGEAQRPAVELACGLLPPVILAAAVLRLREAFLRPWRWDLAALGFVLTLCILPSVSPFRWSFRWLPLFHLLLALLSAQALTALRADEARAPGARRVTSFGIVLAALGCVAVEWAVIHAPGFSPGDLALRAIVLIAAVAAAFFCWPRLGSFELLIRWLPCLVVVLSLWSTYSHVETRFVRRWALTESIRRPEPLDPEILYLGVYDAHEAYRIDSGLSHLIRPGNIAMYSGVRLLNGYSTIGPAGLARVLRMRSHFGHSADPPARRILEAETGRGGLLELMGVDGLVLTERWRSQVKHPEGWETAFSSEKGAVLHRTTRTPEVRWIPSVKITSPTMIPDRIIRRSSPEVPWLVARSDSSPPEGSLVEYAPCTLAVVRSSRLEVAVEVESLSSERNSLVLFSRPWYPGYRATLDGQTLRVYALNLVMPAVEIPAGAKGTVVLRYSPATLRIGLTVSALALVAGVAASGARPPASRRKPRPPRPRGRRPPARRD